ncbi:MAG: hypothetical protein JWO94_849 [Verrucomicrobiaceae bacterium]|nr:hypothetical protein [Verrucomicrobiaceae bacterium]
MASIIDHADYFSPQVVRTRRFFLPKWKKRARSTSLLAVASGFMLESLLGRGVFKITLNETQM